MCGIFGLITPVGCTPDTDHATVERLRDRMVHRGPDGAGLLDRGNVVLAHRRLAVIDPSPAGHQPMAGSSGGAIVYNGELYNDAELREALGREGRAWRGSSDTETLLAALEQWGPAGLRRVRGMYALGFHDAARRRFVLARDPLGVKPLYYWRGAWKGSPLLIFASEIRPILDHPAVSRRPDLIGMSGYLTTIRTTIGERTLFEGVRTLLPGECLEVDLTSGTLATTSTILEPGGVAAASWEAGGDDARRVVQDSVRAHLRSDVPVCCLLSGGLDSSIIASVARAELGHLWTYCAGARAEGDGLDDFGAARLMAQRLDTRHAEATVDESLFIDRWMELINATGRPLSTPNEVAIYEVARRLRADGKVVTVSGEGADEVFGGYDLALRNAQAFEAALHADKTAGRAAEGEAALRARFQAQNAAWVPLQMKPALLNEPAGRAIEEDAWLLDSYTREFERVAVEGEGDDPVQLHLRFQRRINLAGLLLRLDSSTMQAGVEGRTPFADAVMTAYAERLPMSEKLGDTARPGPDPATKLALRRAFRDDLPEAVIKRAKASFPLPFQGWCGRRVDALHGEFAREFFTPAAIASVAAQPQQLWNLAWPMINLALWGRRWWG